MLSRAGPTPCHGAQAESLCYGLVAEGVEIGDGGSGYQAVNPEIIPTATKQPVAEPLEGKQAGEESKDRTEQAGK